MVTFTSIELDKDGKPVVLTTREIAQLSIQRCPHFIMMPHHYRADDTCRCDDPNDPDMAGWGYEWRDGLWRSPA